MSSPEKIPAVFLEGVEKAANALPRMNKALLAAHVNLDGDALGSLLAMSNIFKTLGKECLIYSSTGVPDYLRFMPFPCPICEDLGYLPFAPESAVYLDCGEPCRLGKALAEKYADWPSVNIDHHLGDGGMGSLANCVYPQAAATAQLVAYIALDLNIPLSGNLGDSVALGLITDTGGFCHGNVSAAIFQLCADLMSAGCDIHAIREKLYNNWSVEKLRLWGRQYLEVQFLAHKELAFCVISREEIEKYHCKPEDLEGLVEKFRKVKNVKVSAILREEREGLCKFSLRSSGNIDVRTIAAQAGGGGHKNAAGGTIRLPLWDAGNILRELLEEGLKKYR